MQKQQINITWLNRQSAKDRSLLASVVDGPFGKMVVLVEEASGGAPNRLSGLGLCGNHTPAQTLECLKEIPSLAEAMIRPAPDNSAAVSLIKNWQNGDMVTLGVAATPKQKEIWQRLVQAVTAGKTCTYDGLANECGTHARVIGGAMGANPIAWLIPCHRVLGAGDKLNGYRWGLDVKAEMLQAEGASFSP